jgi:phospholipid/cholesterol/gamma-HCH transport system permease protein
MLSGLNFSRSADEVLTIHFTGSWTINDKLPPISDVQNEIERRAMPVQIAFDASGLDKWDSGLLTFLVKLTELCSQRNIRLQKDGLPLGAQRLLHLAFAVPERKGDRKESVRTSFLTKAGNSAVSFWNSAFEMIAFIGEVSTAFAKMLVGKARFRRSDLLLIIQECGADALPIVSLISVLVGLILAFVGSIQLKMFGAQIYIADLVGIAMARAMAAVITGIIMAGRTGASFAARIGTMQVNEEIDALKTAGISPIEFLVLPRVIALSIMMPLLTLYADLMGILGGMIVGVGGFDIGIIEYYNETKNSLTLTNIWIGLASAFIFGVLVSVAGCLRGMQCGRSASAVGDATTSAVVTGIVSIVIATAVITILCNVLGI